MTPKQKYEERRRLRAERLLRQEQMALDGIKRQEASKQRADDMEVQFTRLLIAFEKIADVMELWADQQENPND